MGMSKYTKGPWRVRPTSSEDWDDERGLCVDAGSLCICDTWGSGVADDVMQANARLIAAAPEMAEAMMIFVQRVERGEVKSKKTYAQFMEILKQAGVL